MSIQLKHADAVKHASGLMWWPDQGMGYYPVDDTGVYDARYWQRYEEYARAPMGRELTQLRVDLVHRYLPKGQLVDIGIGCGQFVEARDKDTYGYDVNPIAIRWLKERKRWRDPYAEGGDNMTFFDSLEHIAKPDAILSRIRKFAFVSIPIFTGAEHVHQSKHFKKTEHYWYWSSWGFVTWMMDRGFALVHENRMETEAGREGIGTFVFRRMGPARQ